MPPCDVRTNLTKLTRMKSLRCVVPGCLFFALTFFATSQSAQANPPHGLNDRPGNTTLRMPPTPPSYGYATTNAFGNLIFVDPVALATPPGETNRLFVVEQLGRIAVITNLTVPTRTVFLDITTRITGGAPPNEQGLLGLAFHPG